MYQLIRKVLFCFDPEKVHHFVFFFFRYLPRLSAFLMRGIKRDSHFRVEGKNIAWDFPVGIAAGLDKNASGYKFLWSLGFGSIEVGTVTPRSQKGNEKPRVFRMIKEESLRNFMGFPNEGAKKILPRLLKKNKRVLGVNIGKNSDTSAELVARDYLFLYQCFKSVADYIVINISCPNVKDLTSMQQGDGLEGILKELDGHRNDVPLFVKIGPSLEKDQLDQIVVTCKKYRLAGIVATNTITDESIGRGGISGKLLVANARDTRNYLLECAGNELDIIGAGGFFCFEDVWEFIERGGRFVQIYTSFIYQGPDILKDVKKGFAKKMDEMGVNTLQELFNKLKA